MKFHAQKVGAPTQSLAVFNLFVHARHERVKCRLHDPFQNPTIYDGGVCNAKALEQIGISRELGKPLCRVAATPNCDYQVQPIRFA